MMTVPEVSLLGNAIPRSAAGRNGQVFGKDSERGINLRDGQSKV
jgi:hypothetical protein